MLGTAAAVSDYLLVSCITPLKPGDEDYANTFVVPVGAKGLKLYCRPPYAMGKSSVYDYPLSTRFDETDALAVFDDVFVPWEDVFVYRNLELLRSQFFETAAHVLGNSQAQIRLAVKMKFLIGLARKVAAATKVDTFPGVQHRDAGNPLDALLQQSPQQQPGVGRTDAQVRAESERDMGIRFPIQPDFVRLGENPLVVVRRGPAQ